MSKLCPVSNVPCSDDRCESGDGIPFCSQEERNEEFQRGYKVGMAVMRSYIAGRVKSVMPSLYYAEIILGLPDPTFPTDGITVQMEPMEVRIGTENIGNVPVSISNESAAADS